MASIRKEVVLDAPPETVWSALRDVGAIHTRLAPGFVTDVRLEGDARIVTFANGAVARERIVTVDDAERRVVWSATGGPLTHHNGSAQAAPESDGRTRFVWIADLLPNEAAPQIAAMMDAGLEAIRRQFGRR